MLLSFIKNDTKNKEKYRNADIGNKSMLVFGQICRDGGNDTIYDETGKQYNCCPGFLFSLNRIRFELNHFF